MSDVKFDANRWGHVAITGEATPEKKWRVRLFLDGQPIKQGVSQKLAAPTLMPSSLILSGPAKTIR